MNNSEGGLIRCEFEARRGFDEMKLSEQAERIYTSPNAGGNSVESEVLSFELLKRCFRARLLKTEMEVNYFPYGGSITDYTCHMFDTKLGVSVTRAMKFKGQYETEDAEKLLRKKLLGITMATRNSLEGWSKQILHVWAASAHIANTVADVYYRLSRDITSNTVVLITTASRRSSIFSNSTNTRGRA